MLTELLAGVVADLEAGDVRAVDYMTETPTPSSAIVTPGQPFIVAAGNGIPFGHQLVRIDVLLLVTREAAKTAAERMLSLVESAQAALTERDVVQVTRPGLVTLNAAKFIGCVVTIEVTTEAP